VVVKPGKLDSDDSFSKAKIDEKREVALRLTKR